MNTPDLSVLDAWIDDEPVAKGDVLSALATSEGRQYLVDAMRLRRLYRVDDVLPVAQPVAAAVVTTRWPMLAAAAAVLLAAATGFVAGTSVRDPAPAVVVTHVPEAAPKPTRVISLTPGVDWNETAGGN